MAQVRLDKVHFSTLFEAPKNYDTDSVTLNISGTLGALSQRVLIAEISYSRAGTRADIYLTGNNVKVSGNSGNRAAGDCYQFAGSETFAALISYSSTKISVALLLQNGTASPISLTTQDIIVSAVIYDMPIGATT